MENFELRSFAALLNDLKKHISLLKTMDEKDRIDIARQLLYILNELNLVDNHDQNRLFSMVEREFNIHILRPNFYSPLPVTKDIPESAWLRSTESPGINFNESVQIKLLNSFVSSYKIEYDQFSDIAPAEPNTFFLSNSNFGPVDAEIFYCMIRSFKPKRIIEIGSGYSTLLAAMAIRENRKRDSQYSCELTAIEPYPQPFLSHGFDGLTNLVQKKVEDVPVSIFEQLEANDILFIDSSHVLKIGSDVEYEFLEILPCVKKGVLVHVHDIFLPNQYPKVWVLENHRFWNEQYFLQTFLHFNDSFEVLWGSSYMQAKHGDKLTSAFDSLRRTGRGGGSFWMRRVKDSSSI